MVYDAPQAPNPIYVPGQTPAITAAQKKDDKAKVEVVEVDDANAEQTVAALRTVKKVSSWSPTQSTHADHSHPGC